jgi:bacillithiol system protein YtxJ
MIEIPRLSQIDEIEPLVETSRRRPVMIFKHSLTCPVSTTAYEELQRYLAERRDETALCVLVEIQNARDVSTAIAERTGVRHESPQAIVLRDGEVTWHASHGRIHHKALAEATA